MPSYEEVTLRAGSLQALTGLTAAEFHALLPSFERAFVTYRQDRTIDGQPRTSRRYSTCKRSPGVPSYAAGRMTWVRAFSGGSRDGAGSPQSAASQAAVT